VCLMVGRAISTNKSLFYSSVIICNLPQADETTSQLARFRVSLRMVKRYPPGQRGIPNLVDSRRVKTCIR
jgi:hypothetical protein